MFQSCDFAEREELANHPSDEHSRAIDHHGDTSATTPKRESLQDFVSALKRKARFAAAVGKIPQLTAIASELFLGKIRITIEEDPELEDKRYVVVHVEASEPIEQVASHRREWYNLTHKLLGAECELVQLAITIV